MKLKSWHLALLGILLYFVGDCSLITDFMACKGFCSADGFSASLLSLIFPAGSFLVFVLSFRFEKTRKFAAISNILVGLMVLSMFILILPIDHFSSLYLMFLSSLSFLSAGLLFFLKENKAENTLKNTAVKN